MSKDVLNQIKAEEAAGDRAMQEGQWEEWYSDFCKRGVEEGRRHNEFLRSLSPWQLWAWRKFNIRLFDKRRQC